MVIRTLRSTLRPALPLRSMSLPVTQIRDPSRWTWNMLVLSLPSMVTFTLASLRSRLAAAFEKSSPSVYWSRSLARFFGRVPLTVTARSSPWTNVCVSASTVFVHDGSAACAAWPASVAHTLSGFGLRTRTGGSLVGRVSLFHVSLALFVVLRSSAAQDASGASLTTPPIYIFTTRSRVPSAVLASRPAFAVAVVV